MEIVIMIEHALPILYLLAGVLFMLERFHPAHPLKPQTHWYIRAAFINILQLSIFFVVDTALNKWHGGFSLFNVSESLSPLTGAFLAYFIFTFMVYWWHRLRHSSQFFWKYFHQLHHSPQHIETLTAYYIHPLDMIMNLIISNTIMFFILGLNFEGAAWYTLITGFAGFFIHANIHVPRWVGYVYQTPEMHRLHHQSNHHAHNYSDFVCWDLLFGTYCNPEQPIVDCGFDEQEERQIIAMLFGKIVSKQTVETTRKNEDSIISEA
jgi:sterol desaturase/sphingolipid hydroxylase (fatty acid hydroxylase superfamily)